MPGPRVGFACVWDQPNPIATWSYTPWQLREAMRTYGDIVDVGVEVRRPTQLLLKALHARRRGGRLITTWQQSRLTDAYFRRVVDRRAHATACDAVFEIGDVAVVDRPFYLYQDLSFDALLEAVAQGRARLPLGLTRTDLLRRRDRQRRVYERAAGVFAMSHWLGRHLVGVSGLEPHRVHVVHPGRSAVAAAAGAQAPLATRGRPRRRLLLVGADFVRKGGMQVLAALAILRREVDPAITLTVAGPRRWPLPGALPDGVDFLGPQPRAEVVRLYDTHDLLVMPSHLEGFGIVFAEAIARGLPCVARDAYAMPEVVEPGVTGMLVDGDDPATLAAVVTAALDDDSLYAKCRGEAVRAAAWFAWPRAGRQVMELIRGQLGASGSGG